MRARGRRSAQREHPSSKDSSNIRVDENRGTGTTDGGHVGQIDFDFCRLRPHDPQQVEYVVSRFGGQRAVKPHHLPARSFGRPARTKH